MYTVKNQIITNKGVKKEIRKEIIHKEQNGRNFSLSLVTSHLNGLKFPIKRQKLVNQIFKKYDLLINCLLEIHLKKLKWHLFYNKEI